MGNASMPIEQRLKIFVRYLLQGREIKMSLYDVAQYTVGMAENYELVSKWIKSKDGKEETVWMGMTDLSFGYVLRMLDKMDEMEFVDMAADNALQEMHEEGWRGVEKP